MIASSMIFNSCFLDYFLEKSYEFKFVVKGDADDDGIYKVLKGISIQWSGFYTCENAVTNDAGETTMNIKLSNNATSATFYFNSSIKNEKYKEKALTIVLDKDVDLSSYSLYPTEYYEFGKIYNVILERKTDE